jgi:hypothetical protein
LQRQRTLRFGAEEFAWRSGNNGREFLGAQTRMLILANGDLPDAMA